MIFLKKNTEKQNKTKKKTPTGKIYHNITLLAWRRTVIAEYTTFTWINHKELDFDGSEIIEKALDASGAVIIYMPSSPENRGTAIIVLCKPYSISVFLKDSNLAHIRWLERKTTKFLPLLMYLIYISWKQPSQQNVSWTLCICALFKMSCMKQPVLNNVQRANSVKF